MGLVYDDLPMSSWPHDAEPAGKMLRVKHSRVLLTVSTDESTTADTEAYMHPCTAQVLQIL